MASKSDLKKDIEEATSLLVTIQSPRIRSVLERCVDDFKRQLHLLEQQDADSKMKDQENDESAPSDAKTAKAPVAAAGPKSYVEPAFGWSDEGWGKEEVMIYVTLEGIGKHNSDQIDCGFTPTSFHLTVEDLNGTNFRLRRDNLCKEIDPKRSSFKARKNKVVITLMKKDKNDSWSNLTSKSTKLASKQQMDDPGASIMNLMKEMYETGDDEMKRTIAKAWTESRQNPQGPAVSF